MTCTKCPAFKICPEKPVREDYTDENKYLIDLECGVWSCQKTIEKLCKENEQLKQQIEKMKCCFNCDKPTKHLDCGDCHNGSNWELAQSDKLIRG